MIRQDNENFRNRVTAGVLAAVIEAGRAHPDAAEVEIDMGVGLEAMCGAIAIFASTGVQQIDDREDAANLLGVVEDRVVSALRYFADRIREGTFPPRSSERPNLRVVT